MDETKAAIQEFSMCNLLLVGRLPMGAAAAVLTEMGECPELGPIGSLLTSPAFPIAASVLVMQQYLGETTAKISSDSLSADRPIVTTDSECED